MRIESTMKLAARELSEEINDCCPEDKADFFNELGKKLTISKEEVPALISSLDRNGRRLFIDFVDLIQEQKAK